MLNTFLLIYSVKSNTELGKRWGHKNGSGINAAQRRGLVPETWYETTYQQLGITKEQILTIAGFANNPQRIRTFFGGASASAYDTGMDELFAEIRQWWASTDDPTVQGFTLSFAERFPEYKKWRQDRIDIKNPAECGA